MVSVLWSQRRWGRGAEKMNQLGVAVRFLNEVSSAWEQRGKAVYSEKNT